MSKRVKFLQDFQGRETNEIFYKLRQEAELPDHMAAILVADRRAEVVKAEEETVTFENVTGVETEAADEPHPVDEPAAEETTIEDVTTTETIQPKTRKRGKK